MNVSVVRITVSWRYEAELRLSAVLLYRFFCLGRIENIEQVMKNQANRVMNQNQDIAALSKEV